MFPITVFDAISPGSARSRRIPSRTATGCGIALIIASLGCSGDSDAPLVDDLLVALHARCHVSLQLRWHGVPARRSFRSAFCGSAGPSVLERTRAIALSVTAAERRSVVAMPAPRSMRGDLRGTVGGRGCSLRSGEPGDAMRRGVIGTITQWRGATALHCAAER